jgi:hypothetical protein
MKRSLKDTIRRLVPLRLLDAYRTFRYGRTWIEGGSTSRSEVFTRIYRGNLWGTGDGKYYSGPGSDHVVSAPYVEAIAAYIKNNGIRSLVDIGCGDFRVGRELAGLVDSYHGVDIVKELVEAHQREHGSERIHFSCLDVTVEQPPEAQLCLVRQVLQHLSNREISDVLDRCRRYEHIMVTEHILPPERRRAPNLDIEHGVQTRVDIGSCVLLDERPFLWSKVETLCEVQLPDGSLISTMRVAPPR